MTFLNPYFFFFLLINSCNTINVEQTIDISNVDLKLRNGVIYYKERAFTGNLVSYYQNNKIASDIQYVEGRKHGYEKKWYATNNLAEERFYTNGIKVGVHRAWWKNRTLKFVYYFNSKGQYHGATKEWYTTGQLYKDFNYINGIESGKQRLWKPSGMIKANYEVINGERFGLIGLKKCKTVNVNSIKIK
ncbi:hypothetical protein [uncultured Maribacter sp.]|uniref:toxin-antitoxin system YwqK family antitoxin n=1 Tax=uncultured Maribacter sp. TaxID=431308 RepID=UPI00261C21EC|nr:hypothetical protein [uncultured Maribacter sp.]